MPKFSYTAKKGPNDIVEGTIEAENLDGAFEKISRLGYVPVDITAGVKPKPSKIKKTKSFSFTVGQGIRSGDLSIFTRQLSDLISAGVPLLRALGVVQEQTRHPRLKHIARAVYDTVKDGGALSDSLAQHPHIFSTIYVNMVQAGELSGTLDVVLQRLADFADKNEDTQAKIQASLVYPALILSVGVLTIFVLLAFVIPRLSVMFDDLAQELPLATVVLMSISDFLSRWWWGVLIMGAAAVMYFRKYQQSPEGAIRIDTMKLALPVAGKFIQDVEIGRFARTLATLLDNGVVMVRALEGAAAVLDNVVLQTEMKAIAREVAGGASVSIALKKVRYVPQVALNIIATGEESGNLVRALSNLADSYEKQSDRSIKTITSLLEPVLIITVGLVVGFMVIALLLPIFRMNFIIQ